MATDYGYCLTTSPVPFERILVANRSEIAIRVFRAAAELGIRTVAVYAAEDSLSLHRFKSDAAYKLDPARGPIGAYLAIDDIIDIAREAKVDAIHPGYGFLSENPAFAEACAAAGITFIGPSPDTMRMLGDKVTARNLAVSANVPVLPATPPLPDDESAICAEARKIGYPVMLKASWGGGGRGMRVVESEGQLLENVRAGRREAVAAFGRGEVYLEKLVRRARHVEVQILGDKHGNLVHLFERDCSIQRRNQKVIERAPAAYLTQELREQLCNAALAIGRASNYVGAGTVEFLLDETENKFYFIEVNPRIQVEHTVTEMVTGIDIVKAQILVAAGGHLGNLIETGVPAQEAMKLDGHALQCRITTEDPYNNFIPDYGRITAYRGAFGFGVRIDGGTAYSGAIVTRHFDPLLEKVTAWARSPEEAIARMRRALREYRIRGVATNLGFLENVLDHPAFFTNTYTTRFIDDSPELLRPPARLDRASRLLNYVADVTVNGHPDVKGRAKPGKITIPPAVDRHPGAINDGTRQTFKALGAAGFARWMREQKQVLVTDTTMRDAHQSLLATRMRTADMVAAAGAYAHDLPQLLSLECWGGATFDVAMRFLQEDPWDRLAKIRDGAPNILLQMLLRGANAVGYTNYPDNVVRHFIDRAAKGGVDIFRIFDCLNWVENMRVAIDAVVESGKIAEGALCYTGDILDPNRAKYSLKYYVDLARQLETAGCHVLAIKDMAGLLKPAAARALIGALREVSDLPIHFHTHDTSGGSVATVMAAIDAGVDAVDGAIDSMSGMTSQPNLGTIIDMLRNTPRDSGLDPDAIRRLSRYWGAVRGQYVAFESDMRAGASEVYCHEMPGGQFTNLQEQAKSLGLGERWGEVSNAYASANRLFGDIVKVTPSSKVVGDMALMMVTQHLSEADVLDEKRDIDFPASVVEMMRGDLGQPPGGWPAAIQKRVLKGEPAITARPAALLPPVDLDTARAQAEQQCERMLNEDEFASWLMYPKVASAFAEAQRRYGPVAVLPTRTYFYGMELGEEISVDLERGKTLIVRLQALGEVEEDGKVRVFFELNGQARVIAVLNRAAKATGPARRVAAANDPAQIGAPMPGVVAALFCQVGQAVKAGDVLLTLEAMKMETAVTAPRDGIVKEIAVTAGTSLDAKDLVIVLGDA